MFEISATHNEKREMGEFDTRRSYRRQEGQRKTASNRHDELV